MFWKLKKNEQIIILITTDYECLKSELLTTLYISQNNDIHFDTNHNYNIQINKTCSCHQQTDNTVILKISLNIGKNTMEYGNVVKINNI